VAVTKTETFVVASLIGVVAFVLIGVVGAAISENKSRNEPTVAAGFVDFAEMDAAKKNGIDDPKQWRAKVAADDQARKVKAEKDALDAATKQARELTERQERERPAVDRMSLSGQSWESGGFGSVGLMSMSISNKNPFTVRDIKINCYWPGCPTAAG
jgi:hypothetical protein